MIIMITTISIIIIIIIIIIFDRQICPAPLAPRLL